MKKRNRIGIIVIICLALLMPLWARPVTAGLDRKKQETSTQELENEYKIQQTKDSSNARKVRVGFPIQAGLTEKTKDGDYIGYTVDYLNQLGRYVNWDIEYVEAEGNLNQQLVILLEMLEKGEIDLLGAMNYNEALEEMYLYPSYNYGTAYTTLCVKEDSSQYVYGDFQNWDGMTVAVYPGMQKRESLLSKFAEVSGFTYEKVECETIKDCVMKVLEGEVDATIQTDISMVEGMRSVARFSPSPYYFAANKEQTDLIREMNVGMNNLTQSYPNLQTELYNKYFYTELKFLISKEDKEWIRSLGKLRVLVFNGNMPIQGSNGKGANGLSISVLDEFSSVTGLKYELVFADSYDEGREMIENGEVDCVAAVPAQAQLAFDVHLQLSFPYFKSNAIYVSAEGADKKDVSIQGLAANTREKLKEMNRDPGRAATLDAFCVNYYMHKSELYNNLIIDWSGSEEVLYSFGLTEGTDERLIKVFNYYLRSLSDETTQQMLYQNSINNQNYTLAEYLYIYKWHIIIFVCGLVLSLSLYFFYRKSRELQRDKAESERLYEFSKMTEECLFEYDDKRDKLILRNNQMLFPNHHIVYQFRKKLPSYQYESENEKICAQMILDMVDSHETKRDFALNVNGIEHWYKMVLARIESGYIVGRITDANQDIRERQELERKARTDHLTGLLNRAALETVITEHIQNSYTNGGAYLLMDLDNFKNVNDMLGHREGDRLLCKFASELSKSFRGTDLKARLGGDEFVVFIANQIEESKLSDKLTEFIQHMAEAVFAEYRECGVSVSIGAAYLGDTIDSAELLYKEADGAMYVAKYGGKNEFFISDGEVCLQRICIDCKPNCRQKEYLKARNKLV